MEKVIIVKHPLILHKLTRMRNRKTGSKDFRALLKELSSLMTFEITRDIPTRKIKVETPLGTMISGETVEHSNLFCIPIFRAGIGMVEGVLDVIPNARVGHIGMYRDPETLQAVKYYSKLPTGLSSDGRVLIIDPMLATGHTMVAALDLIKKAGAVNLRIMCLVAAPEGVAQVRKHHKDVLIYTAAVDERLDENGYILPGLGDAGDRIFGTR
ncbi:MAG: uracil phosphoribosyltransferase [Elusimicrobia bacterium]|nr:uracil phosphoribosyltransferase [Elusimicrobiota bacterium]